MSELILKNDDSFRVASRHFIHTLNRKLETCDKRLDTLREEASLTIDYATLEKAYPSDLFSRNSGNLDVIEEEAARIAEAGESYRVMALEVQAQFTQAMLKIESDVAEHRGTSEIMDNAIDDLLMELFALLDVPTFIKSSIDRRTERVQALLESPSPSKFASLVGVDFTQKATTERIVDSLSRRVAEAEEDGSVEEMNWEGIIEDETAEFLWQDLFEEAGQRIKDGFVDNEARAQVMTTVMDKVQDTLMGKMCPKVYEQLSEDNPALAPA